MARIQKGNLRGHQQSKTWIWRLQLPLFLVRPQKGLIHASQLLFAYLKFSWVFLDFSYQPQTSSSSSSYPVYPAHRKTMDRIWGGKDGGNSYP